MVLLVGVLNLLLLHFVVHTCKNTQIIESLKPVHVWNVKSIYLSLLRAKEGMVGEFLNN